MRVLLTTDTVGGVWTYALELAAALTEQGVDVGLATLGVALSQAQRRELHALPQVQVFQSTFKLEWMSEPWEDVHRSGQWLLEVAEEFCPDVVHLNSFGHGALPWRCPVLIVAHSCVLSWWRAVKGSDAPQSWDRYRRQVRRSLHCADLVVAPSRSMLNAAIEFYGPLAQTRVIYNGTTIPSGDPTIAKGPIVLAAGRLWDEAKNVGALAAVAPELPWPVCVAGDDSHPDGSRARFENVRMLGRLSRQELASWYRRALIYALPARYEPFGLTALEAALAGCALVLGDVPSLREIWGDAAAFVDPNDDAGLARALHSLIESGPRLQEMARRATIRARRYSPRKMAREYLDAYQKLLPRGESRRQFCSSGGQA